MKFVCSLVSVLVLVVVLIGAPAYDVMHGNWPGVGYDEGLDFETIRSGKGARALEANLESHTQLDELARPRYNEVRYMVLGETNPGVVVGPDRWLFPSSRLAAVGKAKLAEMHRSVGAIGEITRWLEARDCKVVFEFIPRKRSLFPEQLPADLDPPYEPYFEVVREAMLAEGLDVPDLSGALGSKDPLLYFTNDTHWTPEGNHVAAKVIADRIEQLFVPGPVPGTPLDVVFRRLPTDVFIGHEQRVLGFAKNSWLSQAFTNPIGQIWVVGADDQDEVHFGSQEPQPILVVGTSMSFFTASNLIGFLGVEVETHALAGAAAGYRIADIFKEMLTGRRPIPKVLVWEFPEDFPIREGRYFREPFESIVNVLAGAPYKAESLDSAERIVTGLKITSEEDGLIKGRTTGPGASLEYTLPEPVAGDGGSVLCFDMTPGARGPHQGIMEIEWGTDPDAAALGKHSVLVRRTRFLHSIFVPLESEAGTEIRFVRIKLYKGKTDLEIGHVELWAR